MQKFSTYISSEIQKFSFLLTRLHAYTLSVNFKQNFKDLRQALQNAYFQNIWGSRKPFRVGKI